jgi:hypothetical protein
MKFLIQTLVILLIALILEFFLPWWSIALAAAAGGFLFRSDKNFLAGFAGIALLWFIAALWLDLQAATALSEQVANILLVKNKYLLMLVMSILGGLVGGFAALSGSLIMAKKKRYS